jgi:peptidoglycan/LPS O-acetylase OafA/YrhL
MAAILPTTAPTAARASPVERGQRAALPGRVDSIQWLRGIAVLLVVILHAGCMGFYRAGDGGGAHAPKFFNALQFGNSGVDLFFVISGFVMAHSLGRGTSAWPFLVARWRRIWPLFVLASAIFIILFGTADVTTLPRLLSSLFILPLSDTTGYHQPALAVGWTLGFELMFYLLVAITIARRGGTPALLMLTAVAAAIGLIVTVPWAPARMLFNPIDFEFALGIVAWLIWARDWGRAWRPPLVAAGVLLLAAGLASPVPVVIPANPLLIVANVHSFNRTLAWGLPWALIVLGLLSETGSDGIAAEMLSALGDASYSIYLFHFIILKAAAELVPLPQNAIVAFMAIGIPLSVAGGLAIYRWVERPLLRLLRPAAR